MMFMLYGYAFPIIKSDENSFINMDPVLNVLKKDLMPNLPKNSLVGYTSHENFLYLKQQIENNSEYSIRVDEKGPYEEHWLKRLRDGWRPTVLVGMLSSRYESALQRLKDEQHSLIQASNFGYLPFQSIAVSDSLIGDSTVYILVHKNWDDKVSRVTHSQEMTIAYSPTNYNPEKEIYPNENSIRADLIKLHSKGFRGIVTYGARNILGKIPEIARSIGFDRDIIMGIWDPNSIEEWNNAISQSEYVNGYCLGNEGLNIFYDKKLLSQKMQYMRKITKKPVTTSERIEKYFSHQYKGWLLENSDFIFPTVHPYWHMVKTPEEAVAWTILLYNSLKRNTHKKVIFKEVGLPSGGDICCDQNTQARYYEMLKRKDVRFIYFEAFDQIWKTASPAEAHWGFFNHDRSEKIVLKNQ